VCVSVFQGVCVCVCVCVSLCDSHSVSVRVSPIVSLNVYVSVSLCVCLTEISPCILVTNSSSVSFSLAIKRSHNSGIQHPLSMRGLPLLQQSVEIERRTSSLTLGHLGGELPCCLFCGTS